MDIVISALQFGAVGGGETYVITLGEQLQLLGHRLVVFTMEPGDASNLAAQRGLEVIVSEDELPDACDVVIANDAVTSYRMADRYPLVPQIFVVHSEDYLVTQPPQVGDIVQAAVVLHDRVGRRVRALANVPDLIRLRQPIDVKRFAPLVPLNDPPQRALLLGNWARDDRRDLVAGVCRELGIECVQRGFLTGDPTIEPEADIGVVDIVFGKARVILEAMSCGRAAYVYDHNGGDGWVTPERYELLEADNFGGQAEPVAIDAERLRRDLSEYDRAMGPANRDLVITHHKAAAHAEAIVEICRTLTPRAHPVDAPLRELARLSRLAWAAEWRAAHWAAAVQRAASNREGGAVMEQLEAVRADLSAMRAEVASGRHELDLGRVELDRGREELEHARTELREMRVDFARLLRPWRRARG
jgi:hypothetical protein